MRFSLSPPDLGAEHRDTRRFRKVFAAFGYPARIVDLGEPARAALFACLCDEDTAVCVESGTFTGHDGTRMPRDMADFVFANGAGFSWADLRIGTLEAPETGASVILEAQGLRADEDADADFAADGFCIRATGAGIRGEAMFHLDGTTASALQGRPNWPYPLGVDVILTSGTRLLALPRHLAWDFV